jgi:hypothetical protein
VQHRPNQNAAERREDGGAAGVEGLVLEKELPTRRTQVSAKSGWHCLVVGQARRARASGARAWQMTSPSRLSPPAVTDLTATGLLKRAR